ncbi:glycosyltransferase family 2 protein [Tellurirhabdus rosea]|uniref:glycosyltransferase family 2 protein n=1 Tax=Tellurirhabdus rosea TaxID=2674997 RepID=UPI00224CF792|nr:glycosyltransferase family 2 protein [Tellurirhabdus rosea]
MKAPYSYTIRHLQLADNDPVTLPPGHESGWYLVFWWQEIAVGDLYLEPGEQPDEAVLWDKIATAIDATRQVYAGTPADQVRPPARPLPERAELQTQLAAVLEPFQTTRLPAEVPVAVVICTRNRAAQLRRCLHSLLNLSCRPAEIIVVDNAPDDDSTARVAREFGRVTYCLEPRPGLDFARNTGAQKATMPIVAYTDDDVVVASTWVYQLWQSFRDTQVAAMTGLVIASELQTEAQLIFEKHWSFNRGYVDKIYDMAYFKRTLRQGPPVWEIGAGANMAFRRSVFDDVGFFDERLDVGAAGCNGDSEMWYRILARGHVIHYNPRAVAFHEHRRELAALRKQLFNYMRGFTAAALIQQQLYREAGYKRRLFRGLPLYYFWLYVWGFPKYGFRYRTLGVEVRGILSGLVYYLNHRQPVS